MYSAGICYHEDTWFRSGKEISVTNDNKLTYSLLNFERGKNKSKVRFLISWLDFKDLKNESKRVREREFISYHIISYYIKFSGIPSGSKSIKTLSRQ